MQRSLQRIARRFERLLQVEGTTRESFDDHIELGFVRGMIGLQINNTWWRMRQLSRANEHEFESDFFYLRVRFILESD